MKRFYLRYVNTDENLRQAVAVIDQARASIALHANSTISAAHWNLGQLLHERKLESKHGSGVVNRLLRIEENRQVGRYSRTFPFQTASVATLHFVPGPMALADSYPPPAT